MTKKTYIYVNYILRDDINQDFVARNNLQQRLANIDEVIKAEKLASIRLYKVMSYATSDFSELCLKKGLIEKNVLRTALRPYKSQHKKPALGAVPNSIAVNDKFMQILRKDKAACTVNDDGDFSSQELTNWYVKQYFDLPSYSHASVTTELLAIKKQELRKAA